MWSNESMPKTTISVSEFKATCLGVIEGVRQTGEPVVITKRGIPVAELVAPAPEKRPARKLGALAGTVTFLGDIIAPATDPSEWDALR